MSKLRLNDKTISAIPPLAPGRKQDLYYDDKLPGFALRVTKSVKTFVVEKRVKGKPRRVKLGRWGEGLSAADAREMAIIMLGEMTKGIDPNKVKAAERDKGMTLRQVFERYKSAKSLSPKTIKTYEGAFERCLSSWGNKRVMDITKDMVETKHRKLLARPTQRGTSGQAQTAQSMRLLNSLFHFAMIVLEDLNGNPLITSNPVKRLSFVKPGWSKTAQRQGVILNSELAAYYQAVMKLRSQTARDYFLFVLLTGLRRNEAAGLRWHEVNLEERYLVVPAERTKNKRTHPLPLPDYLYEMLKRRESSNSSSSAFVFPGTGETGHYAEPQSAVDSIIERMGKKFMPHDLRRTFITTGERLKIEHYALKRLLNHRDGKDVTDQYIITVIDRLREPMSLICDSLLSYMIYGGPPAPGNVVPFAARSAHSGAQV